MPKRVYVGAVDGIETVLDGRVIVVERGQEVEVSVEQAKLLDAQPDNWATVAGARKATAKDGDA